MLKKKIEKCYKHRLSGAFEKGAFRLQHIHRVRKSYAAFNVYYLRFGLFIAIIPARDTLAAAAAVYR